ncbi:MAG: hypothetical protein KBA31_06740 [Alphaproteobacteria bacterium]|nr:hypothetical protein [Alphaproteobacteria bacterium]
MSSYSYLIGRPDKRPLFSHTTTENEIAHSADWIPIGWLALFEPRDVQLVEEPPESDTYDPETRTLSPTLIRKRDAALDTLRRRRERLAKILPKHLEPQLHGLEAAIAASNMPYVQAVVSDLDMFGSFPGSEKMLRDLVATMDGDNVKQWRNMLAHVDTDMGKDLSHVEFSQMTGVAAVVGYLPENFAISLGAKKAELTKTMPITKVAVAAKRPWWKFWSFGSKAA